MNNNFDFFVNVSQIAAAVLISAELLFLFLESRKSRLLEQKKFTIEYLTAHFEDNQEFIFWMNSIEQSKLSDRNELSPKEISNLSNYLTIVERLAAGVRHDVISFEYLQDTHGKYFRRMYKKLHNFIYQTREVQHSTRVWDMYELLCYNLEKASKEKIFSLDLTLRMQRSIRQNSKYLFGKKP